MNHGKESAIIGRIVNDHPGKVVLKNETGGTAYNRFIIRRPVAKDLLIN